MKEIQYYKGQVIYEGMTDEIECEFSFMDVLGIPYIAILSEDNIVIYIKLERVFSFKIKGGLQIEEVIKEEV